MYIVSMGEGQFSTSYMTAENEIYEVKKGSLFIIIKNSANKKKKLLRKTQQKFVKYQ